MKVFIIRHCETKKNIDNKFDSTATSDDLTPEGKEQLLFLCKFLNKHWENAPVIYSSPRERSVLTAKEIAEHFDTNYNIVESLPPINPGKLAGLTEKQAIERYPLLMDARLRFKDGLTNGYDICFPGGDSVYNYENVISERIHLLLSNNKDFILVTHRSVILALLNIFCKQLKGYRKDRYFYFDTPKGMILVLNTDALGTSGNLEVIGSYEVWKKECYD